MCQAIWLNHFGWNEYTYILSNWNDTILLNWLIHLITHMVGDMTHMGLGFYEWNLNGNYVGWSKSMEIDMIMGKGGQLPH